MFTIKLYKDQGYRQLILEAESFSVLRNEGSDSEITLHRKPGTDGEYNDVRYDIADDADRVAGERFMPERFDKAIIENAHGKTTEIISLTPRLYVR